LNRDIPILATGSAALIGNARPVEIPNQYQIIEIRPDRFKRWTRGYAPDRKAWIGDTRGSATGKDWRDEQPVAFVDVEVTLADIRW
jgi:hypothetical protein